MARTRRYSNNTTEALIDAEMELNREFDEDEKNTEYSPAEVEKNGPETKNGITTKLVNLRKEPSFESDVVEVLSKGERVKINGKAKGFYKVETRLNHTAYVSSDFIKEE